MTHENNIDISLVIIQTLSPVYNPSRGRRSSGIINPTQNALREVPRPIHGWPPYNTFSVLILPESLLPGLLSSQTVDVTKKWRWRRKGIPF
jgi:hypothetical protein